MKSQSFRVLLLSAFVLSTPGLTFAREDGARVYTSKAYETQEPTCINRNISVKTGAISISIAADRVEYAPSRSLKWGNKQTADFGLNRWTI